MKSANQILKFVKPVVLPVVLVIMGLTYGCTAKSVRIKEMINKACELEETGKHRAAGEILEKLAKEGHETVPILLEMSRNKALAMRNRSLAITVLGMIKDEAVAYPLLEMIRAGGDRLIVMRAIHSLGEIGSRRSIPVLIELLRQDDQGIAAITVFALSRIGEPAIEPLIAEAGGKSKISRQWAIAGLETRYSDSKVKEVIMRALKDSDSRARSTAVGIIGRKGAVEEIKILRKMLNDEDREVKERASYYLKERSGGL